VAVSATNVGDAIEIREIVGREDTGCLTMRLASHGIIEQAAVFGVIGEIAPKPTVWQRFLRRGATRPQRVIEMPPDVPQRRDPLHSYKRAHGLRVI
jgi:hypothetical protein